MSESSVQRTVHFNGRVQGVGFRWAAADLARRFAVTGYVQNLGDRRVRLVAEGPRAEVDAYLAAVTDQMAHHIRETTESDAPASGAFADFTIKRG